MTTTEMRAKFPLGTEVVITEDVNLILNNNNGYCEYDLLLKHSNLRTVFKVGYHYATYIKCTLPTETGISMNTINIPPEALEIKNENNIIKKSDVLVSTKELI